VVQRYVIGALLVAAGLLFSVIAFELQDIDVLSRLVEASPTPNAFGGVVRPASETTISVDSSVRIEGVRVEPGQIVAAGTPLFSVDDREARLALPSARLEAQDAALQVRQLELSLESVDPQLTQLSSKYTLASADLDIASRRAATIPAPQLRDSVERAQAAYELAMLKLQRLQRLHAEGIAARQDVDDAATAVRIAENDLALAKRSETALNDVAAAETSRAELRTRLEKAQDARQRLERAGDLERARIRYQRAVIALDALETRLATSTIDAPANGTIAEVQVSRGDLVPAGGVLARMADLNRLVVEVQVPSDQMSRIAIGNRAQISISATRELHREGIVRSVEPTPGANGTHRVVVEFPNPGGLILTGQAADIIIQS
jgi:multidrug resistance efflux pump